MSTYRQLKQQIAELEKKAAIAMKTEVRKVIESIKKQIAEFGLSAADLGLEVARRAGAKVGKGRKKSALKPKYRDPVSGKTWNGHGKRPRWIVAAQEKGKLDDLLINQSGRGKAAKPATKAAATRKTAAKKTVRKASSAAKPAAKKPAKKVAGKAAAKKRAAPKTAAKKAAPRKPRAVKPAPVAVAPAPAAPATA